MKNHQFDSHAGICEVEVYDERNTEQFPEQFPPKMYVKGTYWAVGNRLIVQIGQEPAANSGCSCGEADLGAIGHDRKV